MQESSTINQNLIFCPNKNQTKLLCINDKCASSPFICLQQFCCCLQNHKRCKYVSAPVLISKIHKKTRSPPKEVTESVERVIQDLNKFLDFVSEIRNSLEIFLQNYGLNQAQCCFKGLIEKAEMHKINAQLLKIIHDSIDWETPQTNFKRLSQEWKANAQKLQKFVNNTFSQVRYYASTVQSVIYRTMIKSIADATISKKLPRHLLRQIQSQMLNASQCGFLKIPYGLKCYKNIKQLHLSRNNIEKINFFQRFKSIRNLNLSENKLISMQGLSKCRFLTHLVISKNFISEIGTCQTPNLKFLDLSENSINSMKNVELFTNLQELYLQKNKITALNNIQKLKSLKVLNLQRNRLSSMCITANAKSLTELNLSENNQIFNSMQMIGLRYCQNLKSLYLYQNSVSDIPLSQQIQLVIDYLHLKGCKIFINIRNNRKSYYRGGVIRFID